jgi:hypothetical protein
MTHDVRITGSTISTPRLRLRAWPGSAIGLSMPAMTLGSAGSPGHRSRAHGMFDTGRRDAGTGGALHLRLVSLLPDRACPRTCGGRTPPAQSAPVTRQAVPCVSARAEPGVHRRRRTR